MWHHSTTLMLSSWVYLENWFENDQNRYIFLRHLKFLLSENNIRGRLSSVIGDHNVESDENTKLFNIDASNLYGWAMSQPLPRGDFENLDNSHFTTQEIIEDLIIIPDDNESGFFIEGDLKYPVEIKEKTKEFPLCPYQTKADPEIFTTYIKSVKQPIYKPTNKLMCDQTKKNGKYDTS